MISPKINKLIKDVVEVKGDRLEVSDQAGLKKIMDSLVYEAVFGKQKDLQSARWVIWEAAQELGVKPASINDLYMARGREEIPLNFSVPAMNLRPIGYYTACSVFKTANKLKTGAMIFELSRGEMGYTDQGPEEYATVVLAAGIKEGWKGPVFIQGDHFQTKQDDLGKPKKGEVETVKKVISESIASGIYNIDIDASTLVDLDKPTEPEQQKDNIDMTVKFTKHIRENEPKGVTISVGAEIGHIGGKNSTVKEFEAFMEGYNATLPKGMVGISKIALQTGTSHGGVVLPDGTLADINLDFSVLEEVTKDGREKYQIAGGVQHGASTLPDEYFKQFVAAEAAEVHLATGFQNILIEHPSFPKDLLRDMNAWLDQEKADERKPDQTDEQFHYSTRKKSWGGLKKQCWDMDENVRKILMKALEERFEFLFKELNVVNTKEMVEKIITAPTVHKKLSEFGAPTVTKVQVKGLAD